MAKVLLLNPSYLPSYGGAKAGIVNPIHPTLGLATIAATAQQRGHQVSILDLSWRPYDHQLIRERILADKPDIIGISATTPMINQLRDITVLARDISPDIVLVGGGAHPSAMPYETMMESHLDIICAGESDYSFAEVCDGMAPADIKGIWYRNGDQVLSTGLRAPIENLDDLPMPAWELYDPEDYKKISRLICRRPPITMAEFSRGCVFKCDFCASKVTMHQGYRKKSPERCADEVERMYQLGFREFMLADDIFTSDQKWAVEVCEAISRRKVDMIWAASNGIRVESADDRLFNAMRRAGCYRVSFGFETGNDEVLRLFGKGGRASIEQGKAAVQMARRAGIDTTGFFMLGLSPDTEETMLDTIEFARQLPLDMMKFGVSIAFPGTKMYNDYVSSGLVRSFNWDEYFIYTDEPLFSHKNLTYDTIKQYMALAYRKAITRNPGFIFRRILRGFRTGEFFWDVYYGIKFFLMPAVSAKVTIDYYGKDRWPCYDFQSSPPRPATWQVVGKTRAAAPTT
ncbi:MAG: B12-binding domain-containing radical SAM protein [Alphaproteobacteria bacterium]|nr:B12-binding domain-containing radical SAM protein [Alphaproteobacteria bacterium]